jgi:2-dehydro-3-deoxygalactonokinase
MAKERGLAASLFRVRARSVLDHVPAVENGWFLSGLLVGAELADLLTRQPAGPILLAATSPHRIPYELAVRFLGAAARLVTLPDAVTSHATVIAHARFLEAQCSAART